MYKSEGKEGQKEVVADVCLCVCVPVRMVWSGYSFPFHVTEVCVCVCRVSAALGRLALVGQYHRPNWLQSWLCFSGVDRLGSL